MRTGSATHIVGAYEHPLRRMGDQSLAELHAEAAFGALADAGLGPQEVDAYCCDSSVPGLGPLSMADYLGLRCRYLDTTELGGASYLSHVGHAASAISAGKCHVVLCTMAGLSSGASGTPDPYTSSPEASFENQWGITDTVHNYALVAMRYMWEFGVTSKQLAEVKVAASLHAQHNPRARLPAVVTAEDVMGSPMISDPLHRLDCCVNTDGAGALVLASAEIARRLPRPSVRLLGHGEAVQHAAGGQLDLLHSAAEQSGPAALSEAGVAPKDIDYASIYDSFTITVLRTLEDLGFCGRGQGGSFVQDGALMAPSGALPVNTDGGSLCNNHPGGRGGMPRLIEAVRQLRGEAHPKVQVPDCQLALVHGTGGRLGSRSTGVTLVLGQEDA